MPEGRCAGGPPTAFVDGLSI